MVNPPPAKPRTPDPGGPQLSVVIPAYNEEAVLAATLEDVIDHLTTAGVSHEVIVADDGSTDRTAEIVAGTARSMSSIRLLPGAHRGKGAAVKRGMLEARGAWVLFMDADSSTPIEEWKKFEPLLEQGCEVVIGSRRIPGAAIKVHQPRLRETLGVVFTQLSNLLVGGSVSDFTCGFKCFQRAAALRIFALQRLDGWGFDAEILFIARRLGHRIREVPVVWTAAETTKVRMLRDGLRSFTELLTIRLGACRGWYPRP